MINAEWFFKTAIERHGIFLARQTDSPAPWTQDPVFKEWRFCNVFRELDKTTVWFRENIRSKIDDPLHVTQATLIFRWFNRISTAEMIKDVILDDGWSGPRQSALIEELRSRLVGISPIVTGAYMLKTPDGFNKLDGVLECLTNELPFLPALVDKWIQDPGPTLAGAHEDLRQLPFLGRFTSYEIVTDLRHTSALQAARDINIWASAGPGCAHGLGMVMTGNRKQFNYNSSEDQREMMTYMLELLNMSRHNRYWPGLWLQWEMREVEHWLCEFDKYVRAHNGDRMKRHFKPGEE